MNIRLRSWIASWIGLLDNGITILSLGFYYPRWELNFLIWSTKKFPSNYNVGEIGIMSVIRIFVKNLVKTNKKNNEL